MEASIIAKPEVFDIEMEDREHLENSFSSRSYLRITNKEQLERTLIIKSDSASLMVPEIELEIVASTGRCTSLIGLLREHSDNIVKAGAFYEQEDESAKLKFNSLKDKLSDFMEGVRPFTLIIDDPFSRSSVHFNEISSQPEVIVQHYQRTADQCDEYGVEYKKTFFVTDSYPTDEGEENIDPFDLTVEEYNRPFKIYQSIYDLEYWYSQLKEYTFDTILEPLTQEDAKFIVSAYERKYGSDDNEDDETYEEKKEESDSEVEHTEIRAKLEAKLDRLVKHFKGGAFVRLSSRSPKDAIQRSSHFASILADLTEQEMSKNNHSKLGSNLRDILWYKANILAMRYTSGSQALDILLDSKRVYHDLKRWQDTDFGEMNFIIREWHYIDPAMEFRAFIHNGRMTAVSQYNFVCYFEELKEKNEVKSALKNYFNTVRNLIHENLYKSYVCDFAILEDGRVLILEINPFWNKTGPALFDWEGDRDIIANGLNEDDFCFRIVENEWTRRENFSLSRDV